MKDQVKYFLGSILEAKIAYNAWKMIVYSRLTSYVGEEMANKYVEIQEYHGTFFTLVERSLFFHWVLVVLHCFDPRQDTFSLDKVNKKLADEFKRNQENKEVLTRLKNIRDSLLAHRAKRIKGREIGSVESLEKFFKNIEDLYDKIRSGFDKTSVSFHSSNDIKHEVENLFMNIYKGEQVRRNEIDIDLLWGSDPKRISNVL